MKTKNYYMLFASILLLMNLWSCSSDKESGQPPNPSEKVYSSVLKIDEYVQSNMVIQQNSSFVISGEGTAKQWVKVSCSWDKSKDVDVQVSDDNKWKTTISIPSGSFDIHSITISGKSKIELTDILIGEVWLCSGQSNMCWPMKDALGGLDEMIRASNQKFIRIMNIPQEQSIAASNKLNGKWQKPSSSSLEWFSAVGYFFAKALNESLNVPIGIINASWGDTTAEVWADRNTVLNDSKVKDIALLQDAIPRAEPSIPYKIGAAYNAMIYPLRNIPIKGVIWYQGESNMDNPSYYPNILNTLVGSWRTLWKATDSSMPFYIAQICPYKRMFDFKVNYANPNMRFAQQKASTVISNSGVICLDDIADLNDIHPKNKKDVGIRFAALALKETYKKSNYFRSPIYDKLQIQNNKIIVEFKYAEEGLKSKDGQAIREFEIAGEDQVFYPAVVEIDNNKVLLSSSEVPNPVAARMGWSYTKTTNLVHQSGLPVSVFKTYNWLETSEEQ